MLGRYTGNWWALGLRAIAAILLGLIAFTLPAPTLAAVVLLFGIYAMVDGVLAVIAAARGVRRHEHWGAMLTEGIAGIAAGIIAFLWPSIGALTLAYLVAGWALVTGMLKVAAAMRLRRIMTGEWLLLSGGVLSIVLAVFVALIPPLGIAFLIWWLGTYALAYGGVEAVLAFRVRRWSRVNA